LEFLAVSPIFETPHMNLRRELKQLRDPAVFALVDDRGTYRLIG
jgi:hypothetical protein